MGAMHRPRSLRSRLFSWFFGAILLTILTSALVVATTRPEPSNGVEVMARNMGTRLAAVWDDTTATQAYVGEVRDVTGFDIRLVRGESSVPPHVRHVGERGGFLAAAGRLHISVPVVRDGRVLGALEMERFGPRPVPWAWWRFALAIV